MTAVGHDVSARILAERCSPARRSPALRLGLPVFVVVGSLLFAACGGDDDDTATAPAGTESFADLARDHVEGDLDYPHTPPVGGHHNPVWQTCGVYREPVRDENAVHTMEHGATWIAYSDALSDDDIGVLEAKVDGHPYVLVAPYPALSDPVVLTAWGRQLRLDSAASPLVDEFIAAFEAGPQAPEPGAPCTGGIGTPNQMRREP